MVPLEKSLKGPTAKEWASLNSWVTTLIVEPLSKRAQLSSPSIQTLATCALVCCTDCVGWGSRRELFGMSLGSGSLVQGCQLSWLLVSDGSGLPSSCHPLFCRFKLIFSGSLAEAPLGNLSQDGQDCHIWNNFSFSSGTAQLYWQNGWYSWLADLLHQSHSRFLGFLPLKTQPLLPFLALHIQVPFSSNVFHYGRSSLEGTIALQLPIGKQVPQCLWLGNSWFSCCGGLSGAEDLWILPIFSNFRAARSNVIVASWVFAIHLVGPTCIWYLGSRLL